MNTDPTTRCTRCGRLLTSKASIARGMGATCAQRTRQERVLSDIKPETAAKAREDLADGAIVNTRRTTIAGRRVYASLSSRGDRTYLTTSAHCTCRAGHKGRTCRHVVAVRLLTA
jgi:uncharacterized Zn finger protein